MGVYNTLTTYSVTDRKKKKNKTSRTNLNAVNNDTTRDTVLTPKQIYFVQSQKWVILKS